MSVFRTLKALSVAASVATLAACGGGGGGGSSAPAPVPVTTTNNSIVATPSTTSDINVLVGSSTNFSVTFTTDDGKSATNLSITSGLSSLPAGWTGPTTFSCSSVSTGNGCMANFTYAPTKVDSGSVTFNYSYTNNAGTNKTGTATVNYKTTSANNIVATAAPAGQIAAIAGSTSTVAITFTTDDGNPATVLNADTSALPSYWSAPAANFTCATVTTGNGCMLNLTYAPVANRDDNGAVRVNFSYVDNSGTTKTSYVSIPYVATTQNNVVATQSPAGQIAVAPNSGNHVVKIDFTTDDSNPATALSVTAADLTSLPAGWTGPATFTCASVSTGSGCELSLTYNPTQAGSGTVTLHYADTNNSGTAQTGTVNIGYFAGSDNTVSGTVTPSGTVNGIVGGSQAVTVNFNSSDANPASTLAVTGGLGASLPAGWTGPSSFTCATINNTGNACQLGLTYSPSAVGSGTVQLSFGYKSNGGTQKTGSVNIAYASTSHNNLVSTQSPSGSIGAVVNGASQPVTLTFTSDDGNPVTAVTVTSGLGSLPAGWSVTSNSLPCASVSTGSGCQLVLAYAPTANGSGTVPLGFSYKDDSGASKTSTASIGYASIAAQLYVTDLTSKLLRCPIAVDGSISACTSAVGSLAQPSGVAFSGKWAYVAAGAASTDVDVCLVAADGSLGGCTLAQAFTDHTPNALAVSGNQLYVTDASGPNVFNCTINGTDGTLSGCFTNYVGTVAVLDGIAATATNAYMVDINGDNLTTCKIATSGLQIGSLFGCGQTTLVGTAPGGGNTPHAAPRSAYVNGGNLYLGTIAGIMMLPIANDGTVTLNYPCSVWDGTTGDGTSCTIDGVGPVQSTVAGLVFNNGYAYIGGYGGFGVGVCKVESNGLLDQCTTGTNPGATMYYGGLAVH